MKDIELVSEEARGKSGIICDSNLDAMMLITTWKIQSSYTVSRRTIRLRRT